MKVEVINQNQAKYKITSPWEALLLCGYKSATEKIYLIESIPENIKSGDIVNAELGSLGGIIINQHRPI